MLSNSFRRSIDHGQLVNPTYEGDDLLYLQPAPTYETISPHPRDGTRLEFIEQGENGYHVLSKEERVKSNSATTTHMETLILEDSREESYSKLELREESGSTMKASNEGVAEYSRLETVNIGPSMPKDTCMDNDTTVDSSYDNSEQTEGKESVMDNKTFNDNDDACQLATESGDVEKGQHKDAKGKLPLITITSDVQNER